MNRSEAINAASKAAQSVLATIDRAAGAAFAWNDALDLAPAVLAQFCECHPEASARELYHFGVRAQPTAISWERCHPAQRAAVATFQGAYRALAELAEADEAKAPGAPGANVRRVEFKRRQHVTS